MDFKKTLLNIFWILAVAPFVTAMPLYLLMPKTNVQSGLLSFIYLKPRAGIFIFPAAWFLVNLLIHFAFKWLDRQIEEISYVLLVIQIIVCLFFSTAAIIMELSYYHSAMTYF